MKQITSITLLLDLTDVLEAVRAFYDGVPENADIRLDQNEGGEPEIVVTFTKEVE